MLGQGLPLCSRARSNTSLFIRRDQNRAPKIRKRTPSSSSGSLARSYATMRIHSFVLSAHRHSHVFPPSPPRRPPQPALLAAQHLAIVSSEGTLRKCFSRRPLTVEIHTAPDRCTATTRFVLIIRTFRSMVAIQEGGRALGTGTLHKYFKDVRRFLLYHFLSIAHLSWLAKRGK